MEDSFDAMGRGMGTWRSLRTVLELLELKQCAAVKTCCSLIRVPPQK